MLSKAQIKHIRSLSQQKYRKEHQEFIAEGDKIVKEWLISSNEIKYIIGIEDWISQHLNLISLHPNAQVITISSEQLEQISTLQTPNKVLCVVELPHGNQEISLDQWSIVLENIQDPGNMGTIIRIADWFGIQQIICSEDCVDIYNPKVIQAAMGGHLRVKIIETNLQKLLPDVKVPILAATINGQNLSEQKVLKTAFLMIGNESKGLSPSIIQFATKEITIPKFGGAESLNAAVATGIICAHFIK